MHNIYIYIYIYILYICIYVYNRFLIKFYSVSLNDLCEVIKNTFLYRYLRVTHM